MNEPWNWITELQWAQPWWALAFLLPVAWLLLYWLEYPRRRALPLPGSGSLLRRQSWRMRLWALRPWLKMLSMVLLVLALMQPRQSQVEEKIETDAIDIMMVLDISTSMNAMDFQPNRMEAAKTTVSDFIDKRPNDQIGLVVFSGKAFTQAPLTNDHEVLKLLLRTVQQGWVENGTAIGLGLATGVLRLKESKTLSKVIILLTDGVNNRFEVSPIDAMHLAQQYGIRVYTIGMGTNGLADVPKTDFAGNRVIVQELVEIDEALLREIAAGTDGKYFRATDQVGLDRIYEEIDQLEKTRIEVTRFIRYQEWYWPFALCALMFFLLEIGIRYAAARGLPDA